MRSVFALPAILLAAQAVFAQDSASGSQSAAPSSATGSATGSAASASATGSAAPSNVNGTATGSTAPTPTGSVSPSAAVPTDVSPGCGNFLTQLDNDSQFSSCMLPLLTATNTFAPSANNTTNVSNQTIIATLNTLCQAPSCPDSFIRTKLSDFYTACKTELTSNNTAVLETYDILYVMEPLTKAICTQDNGTYCVLKAPARASSTGSGAGVNNAASSSDASLISNAANQVKNNGYVTTGLTRRDNAQSPVQYSPDTEVYRDSGVMYLFAMPSLSSATLCTNCTSQIMAAYAQWEAAVPYAAGLGNSPMLGTQATLWQQITAKCGASYVNQIQSVATTENPNTATSDAVATLGWNGGLFTFIALASTAVWAAF